MDANGYKTKFLAIFDKINYNKHNRKFVVNSANINQMPHLDIKELQHMKFVTKLMIFILGVLVGLLLREVDFINTQIMPVILRNQLFIVIGLILATGIVLVVNKKT